jgi:hypothetical protein
LVNYPNLAREREGLKETEGNLVHNPCLHSDRDITASVRLLWKSIIRPFVDVEMDEYLWNHMNGGTSRYTGPTPSAAKHRVLVMHFASFCHVIIT